MVHSCRSDHSAKMVQFGIAAALLAVFTVSSSQDAPVVNILPGAVLGTRQLSRNGTEFFSFRGIRFAEPPVDELRFKVSIQCTLVH